MTNGIRKINWKQRNVVDLMGEIIIKINQIIMAVNRLDGKTTSRKKEIDNDTRA
jgi:hypothetical protein